MSTVTVRLSFTRIAACVLIPLAGAPGAQKLNTNQDLGIKVATPVGTLIGQLLFGWLADIVGRKRMCESHRSSRA